MFDPDVSVLDELTLDFFCGTIHYVPEGENPDESTTAGT